MLLPVWLKFARVVFSEQHVRTTTILYVASPISLQFVSIDGQDNVVIAILLALAAFACYRNRSFVSGALVGLSAVLVKFLPLLFAPVFFLAWPRHLRWLGGFLAVLVLGYGGFALMGLPVLYPLRVEAQTRTASNLPYLFESIFGIAAHPRVEDAIAFCALLAVLALIARQVRGLLERALLRILVFGPVSLLLTLLLFSKKSWPPYLVMVLFPLCLLFDNGARRQLRVGLFVLFSVVAVVVQSFWATILGESFAPDLHLMLASGQPSAWFFLGLELLVIAGYVWLLGESIWQIVFVHRLAEAEIPARTGADDPGNQGPA